MRLNIKYLCIAIVVMFLGGISLILLGLTKGYDIGQAQMQSFTKSLSAEAAQVFQQNANQAANWYANSCIYVFVINGIILLVIAFVVSVITYIKFIKIKK